MPKTEAETAKVTDISGITVSVSVLADILGVSDRMVRNLAEEGTLRRVSKGRYNLVESLKNYLLSLKIKIDNNNTDIDDGELDLDEEKAIHERVKRHISELKLQTMKGELHKSEDVEAVMSDMLSSFRTRLLNIPSKVAPSLEERDAAYIRERLMKEMLEALGELKEYNAKDFYSDEYVEGDEYGSQDG